MHFNDLMDKVRKGEILNSEEENKLYWYLGFKGKTLRTIICLLIIGVGVFGIVISCGNNFIMTSKNFYLLSFSSIVVAAGFFFLIVRNKTKKIVEYLSAIDEYFTLRFRKYQGFLNRYVDYKIIPSNTYLSKEKVHFLTDGFNFVIYDDILKDTKYKLPRIFRNKLAKNPMLRIYDPNTFEKSRVSFEMTDVKNFRLRGDRITETEFKTKKSFLGFLGYVLTGKGIVWLFTRNIISGIWKFSPYTATKTTINDNRYTLLVLNNETTFKFGPEVYDLLLETIPQKESV